MVPLIFPAWIHPTNGAVFVEVKRNAVRHDTCRILRYRDAVMNAYDNRRSDFFPSEAMIDMSARPIFILASENDMESMIDECGSHDIYHVNTSTRWRDESVGFHHGKESKIMTMTIMLDVDGVINVFGGDYRKGEYPDYYADTHHYVPDMKKKVYPSSYQGYILHWSKECIHDISEVIGSDKDNKLIWLTSWSPFADTILNPTFGIDNMKNVESADWTRSLHPHHSDKEFFVRRYLKSYPHIPVVWIDDEMVNESSYLRLKEEFSDTVSMLMIQTNEEIGISRRQMSMIRDFNDYPETGIHFMSEANDYRADSEHRGY